MKTSRGTIIDAIEFIVNQIALCSHCQELINNHIVDFKNPEATDENRQELLKKIDQQKAILKKAIDLRRSVSSQLLEDFEGDKMIWCSFKHALASYGYAVELWYADMTNTFYEELAQDAYEQMIAVVSLFLGLDTIVVCGRCLTEQLEEKSKKDAIEK